MSLNYSGVAYFVDYSFALVVIGFLFLLLDEVKEVSVIEVISKESEVTKAVSRGDILLKGEFYKQGHKIRNWKKRTFILYPLKLVYYEDNHGTLKEKGNIDIQGSWIELSPSDIGFVIISPKNDRLRVKFDDENSLLTWRRAIELQTSTYEINHKIIQENSKKCTESFISYSVADFKKKQDVSINPGSRRASTRATISDNDTARVKRQSFISMQHKSSPMSTAISVVDDSVTTTSVSNVTGVKTSTDTTCKH